MGRNSIVIAFALLALPSSALADTVIETGSYNEGFNSRTLSASFGPGSYRFTLTFLDPLSFFEGYAEKDTNTTFICRDDAGAEFPCGGDNVPTQSPFEQVSTLTYAATMTVNPFHVVQFPADPIIRYEEFDTCCSFAFDFFADAPGRYTLSFEAVPEPAAWSAMILGLGVAGATLRRRRPAVARMI